MRYLEVLLGASGVAGRQQTTRRWREEEKGRRDSTCSLVLFRIPQRSPLLQIPVS